MIVFDNVTKQYGKDTVAVQNLNLEVKKGELICLIGPSGCGKTTTMKMINRLISPSQGTIYIEGEDIMKKDPVKLRRSIGYVIQQIGLFPHMTIAENISIVPRLLGWSKKRKMERAKELLKLVDMPEDTLSRYPHELSGGQQQRIGVLRALAVEPPVILMDEPFGALDPITRDNLQDEFKKLQKKLDKTIVFVTHDMDEALRMADRIVIMRDGQVVQVATPDELLSNPADDFVEEFIGHDRLVQMRPNYQCISDIMIEDPITISPDHSLQEAIERMKQKRVDTLLVVDEDGILLGFVDISMISRYHNKAKAIKEMMRTDLFSITDDSYVRDSFRKIMKNGYEYIPVVDSNKHLKGLITRATLVNVVYETLWKVEKNDDSPIGS